MCFEACRNKLDLKFLVAVAGIFAGIVFWVLRIVARKMDLVGGLIKTSSLVTASYCTL